jgi:hypothetical protein
MGAPGTFEQTHWLRSGANTVPIGHVTQTEFTTIDGLTQIRHVLVTGSK